MPQFLRPGHSDMSSHTHVFSEPEGNDTSGNDATLSLLLRPDDYSTIFSRTGSQTKQVQDTALSFGSCK